MRCPFRRPLIALAAVALVVSACDRGGEEVVLTDGTAAAAAAERRTAAPGTARFAMAYEAQQQSPISVTGEGVFDFDAELGRMDLKIGEQATEVVVTRDTVYGKVPPPLSQGTKPWLAYRLGEGGETGVFDALFRLADPRDIMSRLALARDMKRVGSRRIRGVDTVHFRGRLDLSDAALGNVPVKVRERVREYRGQLGSESQPVELWLDDDGRVRRFESEVSGRADASQEFTVKTWIELFSFGDEIEVRIPSPNEVQDAPSFGG